MYRLRRMLPSHLCEQGRHAVRQFSGLNRPARRCLYLRFVVRLATYHARLKVRIESLLLFCRALSSPTTCRFIPAHSHPCVALSSCQAVQVYGRWPPSGKSKSIHSGQKAINPGVWGRAPINGVVSSLPLPAGRDRRASCNRGLDAAAGDCRSGSNDPAPATGRRHWRSRPDRSVRTSASARAVR